MSVLYLLRNKMAKPFQGLSICPRTGQSSGSMICMYHNWFTALPYQKKSFLSIKVTASLTRTFLRFRCGCHVLPIDTGRMLGIPRDARLCLKCNSGLVCDEYHLIFECQTLSQLRAKYCHLFTPANSTMRQFMWQTDIQAVMLFVKEALKILLS